MSPSVWILLLFLTVMTGCTTAKVPEAKQQAEVTALAKNFCALSRKVDPGEAQRAADASVRYPLVLAQEYRATTPAIFNNMLVNAGIHPRGLCFQWADDLTAKLLTLHLQTLQLHRGVARLDTKREHSCVVVTAVGQSFTNGVALDAWRHGGNLNWSPVGTDKYPWREVTLSPELEQELRSAAVKMEAQSPQP